MDRANPRYGDCRGRSLEKRPARAAMVEAGFANHRVMPRVSLVLTRSVEARIFICAVVGLHVTE